jgi:single-strand DNA-binding protein
VRKLHAGCRVYGTVKRKETKMAGDLNRVVLMGRLVLEPELKQTTTGFSVCENRIASKRRFVREGGQEVDFVSFVATRHNADYLCRYFHKGDRVVILGELHIEEYRDKDGNKKSMTKIENVEVYSIKEYLGEKPKADTGEQPNGYANPGYEQGRAPSFENLKNDDDLPF